MLIQLCLATGFAIIVSCLCSIAEAVLYSVPISHVEMLTKAGYRHGTILKSLKNDVSQPITAILTLNTISNTMGASLAGASAAAYFGDQFLGIFAAAFTLAILFFSEIIPKTAGVAYCKELAPFIAYPLIILVKIFTPIIWVCNKFTRIFQKSDNQTFVTPKEIQAIASLSQESGEIDRHEEKIIYNILELKKKTVRKVMTPRTVTFILDGNMTVGEAAELKEKWSLHSRVPVYENEPDNIIGVILGKDVLLSAAEGKTEIKLTSLMEPPHFVPETAPLPNVLLEFFEHRQHLFVVVDEYGGLTGIICFEDIIEEIMGEEIMDESDKTRDMRALARFRRKSMQGQKNAK